MVGVCFLLLLGRMVRDIEVRTDLESGDVDVDSVVTLFPRALYVIEDSLFTSAATLEVCQPF